MRIFLTDIGLESDSVLTGIGWNEVLFCLIVASKDSFLTDIEFK